MKTNRRVVVLITILSQFLFGCICCGGNGNQQKNNPAENEQKDALRADVPPSTEEELIAYDRMVRGAAPGEKVPLKTFTVDCMLWRHRIVQDHPDLIAIRMTVNDGDKRGTPWNAFVDEHSPAGQDIQTLLMPGQIRLITMELGPPSRPTGGDQMFEVVRAWEFRGK